MLPLRTRIGRTLRKHRKVAELTLEQVADRAGLHRNFVGLLERGQANVAVEALERVAGTVGLSLATLFAEVENGRFAEGEDDDPEGAEGAETGPRAGRKADADA